MPKRRIIQPSEAAAPLVTNDALRAYEERLERVEAKNRALEAKLAQVRSLPLSHLEDTDIKIGSKVAAKVGQKEYVPAEVTDVFFSDTSGRYWYEVRRLDEGARKAVLRGKPATELFPATRATTGV